MAQNITWLLEVSMLCVYVMYLSYKDTRFAALEVGAPHLGILTVKKKT